MGSLTKVREQIDAIDAKIQALIIKRTTIVKEVAQIKQQSTEDDVLFYRPERETQILRRVMQRECGPLPAIEMARIFRAIMAAGLALQKPLDIGFLGPQGTFSQVAAQMYFGQSATFKPCSSVRAVFTGVAAKNIDYGIVPIENSIGGLVNPTLQALLDFPLKICGEITLPIRQHLLRCPTDTAPIQKIYSHAQSLSQCDAWLNQHYPDAERVAVASNAKAAQLVQTSQGVAAIAGELCIEYYGLTQVAANINAENNYTRFLAIGHNLPEPTGDDKTSLLITANDKPGVLQQLLAPFTAHALNLMLIKSQNSLQQGDMVRFYLDIAAHQQEDAMQQVLLELSQKPFVIKNLGSYPRAVL